MGRIACLAYTAYEATHLCDILLSASDISCSPDHRV